MPSLLMTGCHCTPSTPEYVDSGSSVPCLQLLKVVFASLSSVHSLPKSCPFGSSPLFSSTVPGGGTARPQIQTDPKALKKNTERNPWGKSQSYMPTNKMQASWDILCRNSIPRITSTIDLELRPRKEKWPILFLMFSFWGQRLLLHLIPNLTLPSLAYFSSFLFAYFVPKDS